jgi:hypothetical protein
MMVEHNKKELEGAIENDERRLTAMRQRHAEQREMLLHTHDKERSKLIRRWKLVDAEALSEQEREFTNLRFRHARSITDLEESQSRELEQFRQLFELQSQLQGAESRGKLDTVCKYNCHLDCRDIF